MALLTLDMALVKLLSKDLLAIAKKNLIKSCMILYGILSVLRIRYLWASWCALYRRAVVSDAYNALRRGSLELL